MCKVACLKLNANVTFKIGEEINQLTENHDRVLRIKCEEFWYIYDKKSKFDSFVSKEFGNRSL